MMTTKFLKKYLFCVVITSIELLLIAIDKIFGINKLLGIETFNISELLGIQFLILVLLYGFMIVYLILYLKNKHPDYYPGYFMIIMNFFGTVYNRKLNTYDMTRRRYFLTYILACSVITFILLIIDAIFASV